jgi:hypothetical protein
MGLEKFAALVDYCTRSEREMTSDTLTSLRELHSRTTDGILVRLLWCEKENRVFVSVNDNKTGEAFSVEVADGQRALHVFDHPFAYVS